MSGKKVYGLYIPMLKQIVTTNKTVTKYLSEDWSLCQRWRDLGGQIFADTSIVLNHIGEISYPMWNVETIVMKKDKTLMVQEISQDASPEEVKEIISKTRPRVVRVDNSKELPEPGFDLKGDK